jgi:twinkle protein
LVKKGKEALYEALGSASPVPVEGIFEVKDLDQAIDDLYDNGLQGGESTGWRNIDEFYTVKTGEWSVVTGIPSHGKSTWVDALLVNLAESKGWNFAVFSPENQPLQRHVASIIQKYSRLPFGSGVNSRITREELGRGKEWVGKHFVFLLPPENELTIDGVLSKAKVAVTRYGIKGLVIDPWNELDHSRPGGMTEPEYISAELSKIRRFARKYQVHVWVIAHPTKLQKNEKGNYPVPTPYDIAGAAHWRNKADNAICVWRDVMDESSDVQIHVQKCRFREVGKVGLAELTYDVLSGRYTEAYKIIGG